jgi:hypothetical protein
VTELDTEDAFCPDCGITLDLHSGPESCDRARHKAHVLEMFGRWVLKR